MWRSIIAVFLSVGLGCAGVLEETSSGSFIGKGLTVRCVSDAATIRAGQTFYLGLWIQHEAGYHTYWQNPGLAGVATKIAPKLPAGFRAGAMIYPPPNKVKMAAISVHGYEHDVLVILPVTAPAVLEGASITIPIQATWMCCQRTCNPGLAKLSITLKCGPQAIPDAEWAGKVQALLAAQPPRLTGWDLSAERSERNIVFRARPLAGQVLPEAPQFFSLDNMICSDPTQVWQRDGEGFQVQLALSDFLPTDASQLRGLLHGQTTWVTGLVVPYVEIVVPIAPAVAGQ